MDKAEKILRQRQSADDFLVMDSNFERTSNHPAWQGKIKCRYCKATGYPGSVKANPCWWGKNHGLDCKWKELWMVKNRHQGTLTYGSNTNWVGNWFVGSNGNAFFRFSV